MVRVPGVLADTGAVKVEDIRDGAAREGEERNQTGRPLVAEAVVHLLREQHAPGAPERAQESFCGQRRRRLVLVRVDEVVVGCVVQEDEAEADGEAADRRADPVQARVRCPAEDKQTDWNEPAGEHHGNQTRLGGRLAVVLLAEFDVVVVD